MIVYRISNIINNKVYIGQTVQTLKKRFNRHCWPKNGSVITSAINKYRKENFTVEPLMTGIKTLEELNYWESFWIKIYNSIAPNGYNLTTGGGQGIQSKECVKKRTKTFISNKHTAWNKGKMGMPWSGKILGGRTGDMSYIRETPSNKYQVRIVNFYKLCNTLDEAILVRNNFLKEFK